uniref:SCP domain-containing protein n=1 Tax=Strongyloides papillosus TaxID=174720 RepID=A0A0N5BMB6_STREA
MNLLLTIVLCTSVIIHIVIGAKKKTLKSNEDDDERIHGTPIPQRPVSSSPKAYRQLPPPQYREPPSYREPPPYKPTQLSSRCPLQSGLHGNLQNQLQILHNKHKQQLVQKYRDFRITKYLSKNSFSNRVYQSVWSDCDFICYFEIGFAKYKSRALIQINTLRLHHKVHILKKNHYLDKLAQGLTDKMANKRALIKA